MFGGHVRQKLSAHAHGELPAEEGGRVAAHLERCAACRREFEEIRLGIRLAEHLPTRTAPRGLWDGVEAAILKESARGERRPRLSFSFDRRRAFAYALALLLIFVGAGAWLYVRATRAAWEVARLEGAPMIDSARIGAKGKLSVGEWLETDSASRAQIKVADLGRVDVDPETRIRLVETRLTEHRLELARGRMHAQIWAPPRVFFVNTPSAVAADLGCAYTLEVDDKGRSLLHVTSGWVALETKEQESFVPAGAACVTQPGKGVGTPFFEDAPEQFLAALARLDFDDGGPEALQTVLDLSRPRDTLTLWHLLPRVGVEERERVFRRLAAHAPPPEGVTLEAVLRLERRALDQWKNNLEPTWNQESFPAVRKAWRKLWQ